MKGLEAAIKNALAKAGHTDAQMRARIYQSARAALESGLRKQGVSESAAISQQRHRLEAVIDAIERDEKLLQIEREEQLRAANSAQQAAQVEPDAFEQPYATEPAPIVEVAPDKGEDVPRNEAAPAIGGLADEARLGAAASQERSADAPEVDRAEINEVAEPVSRGNGKMKKEKPRRRWRARLFSLIILIAFGLAAYWWAESSGLLLSPQERDTSVPNPPPTASDEDFDAQGLQSFSPEGGFGAGWTSVYDPANGGAVQRGADVGTEIMREGDTRYLHISAPAGGAGSTITFTLPQNLLGQMAGHKSMIAVTARGVSPDSQLSVSCNFGGSQGCGNHRFKLNDDRADLIFDVQTSADAGSVGDGTISINAAAGGVDGEIEIYGIHIAPDAGAQGS